MIGLLVLIGNGNHADAVGNFTETVEVMAGRVHVRADTGRGGMLPTALRVRADREPAHLQGLGSEHVWGKREAVLV